jgi:hypothetical protein
MQNKREVVLVESACAREKGGKRFVNYDSRVFAQENYATRSVQ